MSTAPLTFKRKKNATQRSSPPFPINSLPDDILSYIFTYGVELQRESTLTCAAFHGWSQYFYEDRRDSPCEPFNTRFQETVSHVCHRWRALAVNMPLLWKYLDFLEGPPYERTLHWITRTKKAPLDIFIHLRHEDIPSKRTSRYGARQINPTALKPIMDILLPLLPRWRSFVFYADRASHLTDMVETLSTLGAAPELHTLVLHTADNDNHTLDDTARALVAAQDHLDSQTCRLFAGEMPNLRVVKLSRAVFSWQLSNLLRPESNITCLDISNVDTACAVTLEQFLDVLRASARSLQTLKLSRFFPKVQLPSHSQTITKRQETIVLPALTHLQFNYVVPLDVVALLRRIVVPCPQSLTLELCTLTGHEFDFDELLSTIGESVALKSLKHLCMADIRSAHAAREHVARTVSDEEEENTLVTSFWAKLQALEVLDIDEILAVEDGFKKAWAMNKAFPCVDTLCLTGNLSMEGLRSLVESTGCPRPLKKVVLFGDLDSEMVTRRSKEEGWGGPDVEYI